jgi:hypothetical protein
MVTMSQKSSVPQAVKSVSQALMSDKFWKYARIETEESLKASVLAIVYTGAGMALKASAFDTMSLCPQHHRTGGFGVAIHAGQRTWEQKCGLQDDFIKATPIRV